MSIATRPKRPASGARKPRLMVIGEFSAGKTQLINGLLGDKLLSSNVTATSVPPVWLVHGAPACMAVALDGTVREIDTPSDAAVEDTRHCVVSHPSPFLERFDIIDTPGNSDPNIPSESWERMLDYADAAIWCTNATQAWRQSEKAVWTEMPEHLLANATLLVTHADRIPDDRSADRVLRRVRREAGRFFASFLMVSLIEQDDIRAIREHLDLLGNALGPLAGQPCDAVQEFARAHPAPSRPTASAAPEAPEVHKAEPLRIVPRNVHRLDMAPRAAALRRSDSETARSLWTSLSRRIDMSNPNEILGCVERLLTALDRQDDPVIRDQDPDATTAAEIDSETTT